MILFIHKCPCNQIWGIFCDSKYDTSFQTDVPYFEQKKWISWSEREREPFNGYMKWWCHLSIRLSGTAGTKKASHSLRISVRNWRVVWDIYSFFTIQNTQYSWVLYYSAPSSAGNYLYLLEGFLFPLGRSQDSIKSRSKITFLFFMLDTDYLGKGIITRKSPI